MPKTIAEGRKRKEYSFKSAICGDCDKEFQCKSKCPSKIDGKLRCKDCNDIRKKTVYRSRAKVAGKARQWQLKKYYGITTADYDRMLLSQNGLCQICKKAPLKTTRDNQKLVVDHSHTTNKVRGLLCQDCNRGLGVFKDSSDLLDAAATYLKSFNG